MPSPPPATVTNFALYGEPGQDVAPEFIHVERISARSSLYEWTISPHVHPGIFQILLLSEGASLLACDNAEIALAPPCLVTIPCGAVHAFRFAPEAKGWVLSVADALLADPRIAAPGMARMVREGAPQCLALPPGALGDLGEVLMTLLASEGDGGGALAIASVALLLAGIERIAGAAATLPAAPPDRRIALVRRFTALVEVRFRQHASVADYARQLGATPQTLTRACRFAVGKAPAEIAHERLLREAMRALAFSAASVTQVAHDLGFADPAYFSRFFKARTGQEPSRFRRERAWTAAHLP